MILYYIRHGDPIYEPDSLTPLGQRQAEALCRRLATHGMDRIYTSTSNRAIQTAQPLCEMLKKESVQLDWCHEDRAFKALYAIGPEGIKVWGIMDPATRRLLNSREMMDLGYHWYEHPGLAGSGFQEGYPQMARETDGFLESLGYRRDETENFYHPVNHHEERVALFAHWGAGGAIISHILGIPYPQFALHFSMSHSTMTVFEFAPKDGMVFPKILSFGNDSHLYKEGLPTKFVNRIYI